MSDFLALGREYIDKMANPAHGLAVNEEYSIHFARLLRSEEFEFRLREEIEQLRDRTTLTSYGWLWLLGWAKSKQIRLSEELLFRLFTEWSSVFMRCAVVDAATEEHTGRRGENAFLTHVVATATQDIALERGSEQQRETSIGMAESLLIALLQVGKPVTIDTASHLLWREWKGQEQLIEFYWSVWETLDEETQQVWIERIQPPPRNGDNSRTSGVR